MEHEASLTISVEWVPLFTMKHSTTQNIRILLCWCEEMKMLFIWTVYDIVLVLVQCHTEVHFIFSTLWPPYYTTHRRHTKVRRESDFIMNFGKQFSLVLWYSVFIQSFGDNFWLHHFMEKKSAFSAHFDNNVKHGTTDNRY